MPKKTSLNKGLQALLGDVASPKTTKPKIVEQLETLYREWRSHMNKPAWPSKPNRRKIEVDGMLYELNI